MACQPVSRSCDQIKPSLVSNLTILLEWGIFSFTANQKVSQPRKIIYKDDVSESESEPEEEDDDSDFGAKKTPKKSPKKKAATPKKGKKGASKKKTPAKVNKFWLFYNILSDNSD